MTDELPDRGLLDVCAKVLSCSAADLSSASRHAPLVRKRHLAMYAIRQTTTLSYPAIARLFGSRDHTSVLYAADKVSHLTLTDEAAARDVESLVSALRVALSSDPRAGHGLQQAGGQRAGQTRPRPAWLSKQRP